MKKTTGNSYTEFKSPIVTGGNILKYRQLFPHPPLPSHGFDVFADSLVDLAMCEAKNRIIIQFEDKHGTTHEISASTPLPFNAIDLETALFELSQAVRKITSQPQPAKGHRGAGGKKGQCK